MIRLTVADIARSYVAGLEASGVGATVKHFPGLGRVRADTHHFSADLDTPLQELEASDWIPFRKVLAGSKAQLMIGHVTLTSVDPDRPASHSRLVIDGIVRKKWNYQGVIMTDDLVMGAIYQRNVCTAVVEALNAGVDLLLVAFDGAQFYRIFACAAAASAQGKLDAATLRDSEMRLMGRCWWIEEWDRGSAVRQGESKPARITSQPAFLDSHRLAAVRACGPAVWTTTRSRRRRS